MFFIPLIFVAIYLYVREYKISSLVIILFFLTEGFNLIPEEIWETGLGFSKGKDFAFFTLLGIITIDAIFKKNYFKTDTFGKYIFLFLTFVVVCILNNKYSIGLSWGEIIRTVRYQFFWMFYFLFMSMDKQVLKSALNCCFYVSIFTALLFILQLVTGETLLNEAGLSDTTFLGMEFQRFYNQPDMLHFFAFLSIYKNPIKNNFKYLAAAILIAASFLAFHRSWNGMFILSICLGYVIMQSRAQKMKLLIAGLVVLIPVIVFSGHRFMQSKIYNDIKIVQSGDFAELDLSELIDIREATFTFRIALLFERILYINETPQRMLLGAGLVTEDSKSTDRLFDFKIGLMDLDTGKVIQVDSSDISYQYLFLRFGYLGTILYLSPLFYLLYYFYKHRHNKYAFISFLYLFFMFGVSFFADNLARFSTIMPILITYFIVKKEETLHNSNNNELKS